MILRCWIALVAVLGWPGLVHACAVCFSSEDDNRQAFIDTTIGLTILPLALMGLAIWLLYRRIAKVEAEQNPALRREPPRNPGGVAFQQMVTGGPREDGLSGTPSTNTDN